jgi:antitoxin PrlF
MNKEHWNSIYLDGKVPDDLLQESRCLTLVAKCITLQTSITIVRSITMKKYSTVTRKGQVTIPMAVREKLDIAYGEKVEFTINEHNEVVIRPVKVNLEDVYGILEKQKPAGTNEDHRHMARDWAGEKGSKRG